MSEVQQSLKILLLPKDIIALRAEENCLDIVSSANRAQLFEKYLSKRYNLKFEANDSNSEPKNTECRLDIRTTKKAKADTSNFKIGEKPSFSQSEVNNNSVSTMEVLLSSGFPGEITAMDESLKVLCRLIGSASANLSFSYSDKNKSNVTSEIDIKKGEWFNIASVIKDLNDKSKTIGLPQIEVVQTNSKSETVYELQLK